ncbi:hypothetical protein [Treponema pedis]|uniref:hypothetical protein n=1 Tax=Treponema pedis TaxID=409322 RepID=UPI0004642D66|nr:hypothetical protein [Treponema pedis]
MRKRLGDIIFEFHDKINSIVVLAYLIFFALFLYEKNLMRFFIGCIMKMLKIDIPLKSKATFAVCCFAVLLLIVIEILVAIIALCRYFIKNRGWI